jgi:hypothetical protein
MKTNDNQLVQLLRDSQSSTIPLTGRIGVVKTTSPVVATADGIDIPCRQIAGQALTVGAVCVLVGFGIGSKPILIQTA